MDLELLNDACIIPFPNKKILHESYKVGWMLKGEKRKKKITGSILQSEKINN